MCCSRLSLLRNAVDLNNKATELIADAEYDEAITTLSAALLQVKHAIRSPSNDDDYWTDKASTISTTAPLRFRLEDEHSSSRTLQSSPHDHADAEDDEWYLYRYPLQISNDAADNLGTADYIEVVSFAGVYNLALCHHIQALSPTLKKDSMHLRLQRATSFYEHSQKLLSNNPAIMDPDMIHSLVITNNLGHAHYHRGNTTNGQLCFQQLLNAILYISDNVGSENLVASSDKARWDGFMVNIMQHLIAKMSHAAAA